MSIVARFIGGEGKGWSISPSAIDYYALFTSRGDEAMRSALDWRVGSELLLHLVVEVSVCSLSILVCSS